MYLDFRGEMLTNRDPEFPTYNTAMVVLDALMQAMREPVVRIFVQAL